MCICIRLVLQKQERYINIHKMLYAVKKEAETTTFSILSSDPQLLFFSPVPAFGGAAECLLSRTCSQVHQSFWGYFSITSWMSSPFTGSPVQETPWHRGQMAVVHGPCVSLMVAVSVRFLFVPGYPSYSR